MAHVVRQYMEITAWATILHILISNLYVNKSVEYASNLGYYCSIRFSKMVLFSNKGFIMEFSKKDMLSSANTDASLPLLDYFQSAKLHYSFFIASHTPNTLSREFIYSRFSVEEKWQFSVLHLQIPKGIMWLFMCECFNDHSSTHIATEQVGGEPL